MDDSNELQFFTLSFDQDTMESGADLGTAQVTSSKLGRVRNMADLNSIMYSNSDILMIAREDGVLGYVKQNGQSVERLESRTSACLSLDVSENSQVAAVYRDGYLSFGGISASQRQGSCQIPFAFTPTQVKWAGPGELAISTASSKIFLYDTRSILVPSSTISLMPDVHKHRPLRIRTLSLAAQDSLILCTGDDEGKVRVWDRRNILRPVAESFTARKPITSVQFHSSTPSCIVSSAIDGSILQHHFAASQSLLDDVWQMPSTFTPAPINNLAMMGSLTVAAIDNADVVVWRSL
jgi:WD40 repeat protein